MKPRLAELLVCPLDRTPLRLVVWESAGEEITTGGLVNDARKIVYPIYRGVPRMLTFRSGVSEAFWNDHRAVVERELPGYALPNEPSMPGEADVLRTFSSEWVGYDWDGEKYWGVTADTWFKTMRFVLRLDQVPQRGKLVLEVGTGIGGIADYVARTEECEIVGMDLGQAVDVAYKHFGKNPRYHIVQASAFAPPFASKTFDLVYSFGVIHHTFSTKTAFDSLARLPKVGGRMYIWVYSPLDESRTFKRRLLMTIENVYRPIAWRLPNGLQTAALLPFVPLYMAHQWWQSRGTPGAIRYGYREALHAARDRFSPRYVHRHSEEELREWFRAAGFDQLVGGSQLVRPDYVTENVTACAGVEGTRTAG
jgi:uncharacterized protein YbaR (Trm112 family)/SAM-dependent methyltransferase